jgi:hypothetical protein
MGSAIRLTSLSAYDKMKTSARCLEARFWKRRGRRKSTPTLGWLRSELARSLLLALSFEAIALGKSFFQDSAECLGRKYHGDHPGMRWVADCPQP